MTSGAQPLPAEPAPAASYHVAHEAIRAHGLLTIEGIRYLFTSFVAYFPLIVIFASRCDKRSGIGTVIALMLPFFIALTIVWTLFFVAWYLIGIPFGLGT